MSAESATVISFEEYRQRRAEAQPSVASAQAPVMWCPVWVMVPVWPIQQAHFGSQALASG